MRESFDIAFEIVIEIEGKSTNNDPGGLTVFGLAKRWHPQITLNTSLTEAKKIYLSDYWIPAGCDIAPFPMDICLFDGQVNSQNDPGLPGSGNQELLNMHPENWQDFLFLRMHRYEKCSKEKFREGHKNRILKLHAAIKGIRK